MADLPWDSRLLLGPGRPQPGPQPSPPEVPHCHPHPSAVLVPVTPAFTTAERLAVAGILAGYSGLTRQAYELDLRQYTAWCHAHGLALFAARRADIEGFARDLETRGRARATITRRLCTIAGPYKYAVEEELLDHSPAAHVRRPRLDYESHAVGPGRSEIGALLVAAGLSPAADHTPISLLALNGAARVGGDRRGHREPRDRARAPHAGDHPQGRQGRHRPLAPRTARAIDLAAGERCDGPVFLTGGWTAMAPPGSPAGQPGGRRSASGSGRTRCGRRSSLPRK